MLRFRRAHEAHRDARLVFKAATEGRPLELQRRLVLGKLAGGLASVLAHRMTPLEAARANSNSECIALLIGTYIIGSMVRNTYTVILNLKFD